MQIAFNPIVVLLLVVISQSLFAAGLLLFSNRNKLSNRLLSILILAIALWLTDDFMRMAMIYRQVPNLYFLPIFYSLGFGPLLYFYVRSLVIHNFKLKPIQLLHFIPALLQVSLYIFLTCTSYDFKNWYWNNIHQPYTYRVEFDGTWISLTIYLLLSFRLLKQYHRWIIDRFSEVSKIRLNWLKVILGALLILCCQWFVEIILRDVFGIYFRYDFTIELLGIMVLVLGVGGIKQSNLAQVNFEVSERAEEEEQKNTFVPDQAILARMADLMDREQLFLNPTLTLVQFANALNLHPKLVSRHINMGFNKSFNDFVNEYRVEEVKKRLTATALQKLTIMGIALDCGFNSKTTFNRIFKEVTGMAPSRFIS
jgi:AraC-like DNA-binding protein